MLVRLKPIGRWADAASLESDSLQKWDLQLQNLNISIKELTENTEQDALCSSGVFVNNSALTQTYCIPVDSPDLREHLF